MVELDCQCFNSTRYIERASVEDMMKRGLENSHLKCSFRLCRDINGSLWCALKRLEPSGTT